MGSKYGAFWFGFETFEPSDGGGSGTLISNLKIVKGKNTTVGETNT